MKSIFLFLCMCCTSLTMAQQKENVLSAASNWPALIQASEKYFSEKMTEDSIVGLSAAIIIDGKVIWQKGFGYADKEKKIPMTTYTVVNIGSITKTFTALCAMQLQEKGLVNINQPLLNYLPQFHPKLQPGFNLNQVTLKSVITHTSGIQSDVWKNSDLNTGKYTDVVGFINDTYLLYPAGMIGLYSNSGYNLLGHMIKIVSQEDYPAYIHKHLFSILGMYHSGFAKDKLKNRTKIYAYGKNIDEYELRDIASGGIYTDMNDFSKYAIGLLNAYHGKQNKLIKEQTIREMFSLQNAAIPLETNKKGLGWFMFKNDSTFAVYHAGSAGFAQAKLLLLPDKNAAFIVMTNTAEGSSAAEEFCFNFLPKFGLSIPDLFPAPITGEIHSNESPIQLSKTDLTTHEGNYATSGSYINILVENSFLKMSKGSNVSILKPINKEEYRSYEVIAKDTLLKEADQRYFFKSIQGYHYLIQRNKNREYNLGYRLKPIDTALWNKRVGLYQQFGYQMLIGDSKFKSIVLYLSKDQVLMCRLKTMGSTNEIPLDVIDDHCALSSGVNSGFGGFNVKFGNEGNHQIVDFAGITFRKD